MIVASTSGAQQPDGGSPAAPTHARGLTRLHGLRRDALGSVLAVGFSLPAWTYLFGNDQALHWYLGQHWLRGELPYACKGGVCSTCRARVVEGEVTMARNYALEPDEVAAGYVLTCQSSPVTDTCMVYDPLSA